MAKIGNEAKLILKLTEERIQAKVQKNGEYAANCDGRDNKAAAAYRNKAAGLEAAVAVMKSVHLELES